MRSGKSHSAFKTPASIFSHRGLSFSNVSNNQDGEPVTIQGYGKIILFKLFETDISSAQYLEVTFRKNQVTGPFDVIFSLMTTGSTEFALQAGTKIAYDNGSAEMQEAIVSTGLNAHTRTVTFNTGSADVVKAYIPLDSFVNAYTGSAITVVHLSQITGIGFEFSDLGNKDNADLKNEDAVSLREIAAYAYDYSGGGEGGGVVEDQPGPVADGATLVKDLYVYENQNFSDVKDGDITAVGSATIGVDANKGAYFNNDVS